LRILVLFSIPSLLVVLDQKVGDFMQVLKRLDLLLVLLVLNPKGVLVSLPRATRLACGVPRMIVTCKGVMSHVDESYHAEMSS